MKRLNIRFTLPTILVYLFTTVMLSPSLPAQESSTCQADFFFSFLDSTTVHIYNNSSGYDSLSWQFSEGSILQENRQTLTLHLPHGQTFACLTIFNTSGCSDQYCLDIFPGAPGDVCTITDCVWPGDANGDRRANNYDVLNLGLGYGTTGPSRTYYPIPDDPLAWTPSHAENWSNWLGIVNYKHLDCDGNGIIDHNDLKAVRKNYQPDLQYAPQPALEAPSLELRLDETVFFVPQQNTSDSIVLTGTLHIGSYQKPIQDLYGMAFSVRYDSNLTRQGSAGFQALPHSFLADEAPLIDLNVNLDKRGYPGRTDYVISRTDGRSVDGQGAIATFSLIIEGDIIGGRDIIDINVEMEKIKAIDSLGNDIPLNLVNQEITVSVVADNLTSTGNNPTTETRFQLAPNPATNQLWFQAAEEKWSFIDILDLTGKTLQRIAVQDRNQRIDLTGLPAGPLMLRAWTADGTYRSELFIKTPQ